MTTRDRLRYIASGLQGMGALANADAAFLRALADRLDAEEALVVSFAAAGELDRAACIALMLARLDAPTSPPETAEPKPFSSEVQRCAEWCGTYERTAHFTGTAATRWCTARCRELGHPAHPVDRR